MSAKHALLSCGLVVPIMFAASGARAQVGTGDWWWEASGDEGATWRSGLIDVPQSQASVLVRARAAWSADAGFEFAGAKFDAVWRGTGSGSGDVVQDMVITPSFQATGATVRATRMGTQIKIDDVRDTMPPGEGTYGVTVGQLAPDIDDFPDRSNPAVLFTYRVVLDGTTGYREATSVFLAPPQGNTTDRFMLTYTTGVQGEYVYNRPLTTPHSLIVRVRCAADFNGDDQADFFDYLDFVSAFDAEDASADFNGDGQVDFFDYLDFAAAFEAGC